MDADLHPQRHKSDLEVIQLFLEDDDSQSPLPQVFGRIPKSTLRNNAEASTRLNHEIQHAAVNVLGLEPSLESETAARWGFSTFLRVGPVSGTRICQSMKEHQTYLDLHMAHDMGICREVHIAQLE